LLLLDDDDDDYGDAGGILWVDGDVYLETTKLSLDDQVTGAEFDFHQAHLWCGLLGLNFFQWVWGANCRTNCALLPKTNGSCPSFILVSFICRTHVGH